MTDPGTERRRSAIAGEGLFTTRPFAVGERLARYAGTTSVTPPPPSDGMVFGLEVRPGLWLDGSSEDNPARVANHSCEPNADLVWDEAEAAAWLSARQDLPAGTEVTFDYGFSLAEALTHPCLCGSPSCVGRIVAAPLRAALRRHLRHPGARRD